LDDVCLSREIAGGMLLVVDGPGLNAYLVKMRHFEIRLSPEKIMDILKNNGILFGLEPGAQFQRFIRSPEFMARPFLAAKGRALQKGTDARVDYFFETDRFPPIYRHDNHTVDFMESTPLPWVLPGTLLACKSPCKPGRKGRNVFNDELESEEVTDVPLLCGQGCSIDDDGLKLYAQRPGTPVLDLSGEIRVSETYTVNGDAGVKTGHLEFKGDIVIKGQLRPGAKIKGRNIVVGELAGGTIVSKGDICVLGGINGGTIHGGGHVSANYVHHSDISCLGNLTVSREIVDSEVKTSGACFIPKGKIISSRISANQGVTVRDLGTHRSSPNRILMGVDHFSLEEIKVIGLQLKAGEKEIKKIKNAKNLLMKQKDPFTEIVFGGQSNLKPAKDTTLEQLRLKNNKINELDNKLIILEKQVIQLTRLLDDYIQWQVENPGIPMIKVNGHLNGTNHIESPKASRRIDWDVSKVTFKEVRTWPSQANTKPYEIRSFDHAG